jgi:(1->4)-alpha-D-glucan 1-alpha-D-glucosylmutase
LSEDSPLDRLARRCGIVPEYVDIWGRPHRASEATKRALLGAMHVPAATEAEVASSLAALEREEWLRVLPPVVVLREPLGAASVMLRLREADLGGALPWKLREEGGAEHRGAIEREALTVEETHGVDGETLARARWRIPFAPSAGYHRLEVGGAATTLIVAPARCFWPESLEGPRRSFGLAVQLYGARSSRNWGVGDFTDLETLAGVAAERGAGVLGVNPLHALFPENASPYAPSSRLFVDPRYVDVEAIPEFLECAEARAEVASPEFQARLIELRLTELVEHEAVAAIKRPVLERLWRHFRERHIGRRTKNEEAFERWRERAGPALRVFAVHEVLREHMRREDPAAWGWPAWPDAYRDASSPEVAAFAAAHADEVALHEWLQWQCDRQLEAVGRRCSELSMTPGLYRDLAVSVDRGGFDAWRDRELHARGASYGAPPDDFALGGQDWGLPPLVPWRLREAAYRPFVEALRANMRHAGAVRIDHVMGLLRAFWVPPGGTAREGTYVLYPFDDLLGIVALESQRHKCAVIGEDLGTVPSEVRSGLAASGVLSYRLFYFMRDDAGTPLAPGTWPEQALVSVTTHDLPTLAGWWIGRDIALRTELDLFPDDETRRAQIVARATARAGVLVALERERLLPEGSGIDPARRPELDARLVAAIHAYLARTPARLLTVQLEDVLGQVEQVNLPGTTIEYPNWRRRLPLEIDRLGEDPRFDLVLEAVRRERGPGPAPEHPAAPAPGPPRATYRLQLGPGFGFDQAAAVVPYLARLGVSHAYTSPLLEARPGSPHGYDIVDHGRINPEFGGPEAFERFFEALSSHGLGHVADIVPNHMGVGSDNRWWVSVLEHGPASPYAEFFDIDWRPTKDELRGRVLLPVLGDHFGRVLEAGQLRLDLDAERGELRVSWHGQRFPVDPGTYPIVLSHDFERLASRLGATDERPLELGSLLGAFAALPSRDRPDVESTRTRLRDAHVLKARLARLVERHAEIAAFVAENIVHANGRPGEPQSFDLLERLLEAQAYRLAFWKVAADEINYRRFFDINDLAGVRCELPRVFAATHRLVLELVRGGRIQGLRIDHPDGLYDPAAYFRRLRWELGETRGSAHGGTWIVVEKILSGDERLPSDWPVHGTTGYDFSALCGGLFVDPRSRRAMERIYTLFVGRRIELDATMQESKRLVLETALAGELQVLAHALDGISEARRATRDYTERRLRQALADVIVALPVYRTYVTSRGASDEDRRTLELAIRRAAQDQRAQETGIYDFLRDVLLLETRDENGEGERRRLAEFTGKFQQITGPVMAKGVEDTTFYRYHLLLSLDEVGSDPRRYAVAPAEFHRANLERSRRWPRSMLATSTHDSKRSEDVRARISAIAEIPQRWHAAVRELQALAAEHRKIVDGRAAPSPNDEYALYQTLVGVWPRGPVGPRELGELRERVVEFALKAVREAKLHTSWTNPDPAYEGAVVTYIDALIGGEGHARFLEVFVPLERYLARLGRLASLSQTLLKLTCPGVPDIYRGNEDFTFELVDPDNRRPIDWAARLLRLERLAAAVDVDDAALPARALEIARDLDDDRAKLYLTWRALTARRDARGALEDGAYEPLETGGPRGEHLVAFARRGGAADALVVVPRLCAALCDVERGELPLEDRVWSTTEVAPPAGTADRVWRNVLTGERVRARERRGLAVAELLASFPVALLVACAP